MQERAAAMPDLQFKAFMDPTEQFQVETGRGASGKIYIYIYTSFTALLYRLIVKYKLGTGI